MNDDDRDLREMFARLRREERANAPPFRRPTPHTLPHWPLPAKVAAAAAVILIAVVLAWPDRAPRSAPVQLVDLGAAVWESPTDFLLITPGSELLRTVPPIGSPRSWTPIELRGGSPAMESTRTRRNPS